MEIQNFEKERIKALQDERIYIQKKTFTKWANAFLQKVRLEIRDLFTDLDDGKILMKLLEIISGEKLGNPNKGIMKVQKIENLNRCLKFLATKVYFENIGAEDIVDGNARLILGLIWTIILRFQIQEITVEVVSDYIYRVLEIHQDEDEGDSEKRSAKDALLLWCQRKTAGYPGVKIQNFTTSWKNGLGFNALIHAHRSDLINYSHLDPNNHIANLNNAFDAAANELGIPQILDAEDVDVNRPDEKIIVTYVASYYHYFAKMKSEVTGGKRIAKIVGIINDLEKLQNSYDGLTTSLLQWISGQILVLNDRTFSNSLEGIQKELLQFKEYMTVEKPPKYRERGNIEAQYFNIQARLKANGQKMYIPSDGKLIQDIETAWNTLEKCEHGREVALKDELIRQERLEQLARRFARKAAIRESWLNDMEHILCEDVVCSNAAQTEASVKKYEAISAEILARKDRFSALNCLANELMRGNYRAKEKVKKKDEDIMRRWQDLLMKLDTRQGKLSGYSELMSMYREIDSIQDELKDVQSKVAGEDCGKHLQSATGMLEQHCLQEAQLHALSTRVSHLNRKSQSGDNLPHNISSLARRLDLLNNDLKNVQAQSDQRRKGLETIRQYFQFLQDAEEENAWVIERLDSVHSTFVGNDLNAALGLLKKHDVIDAEMQGRWLCCESICSNGYSLANSGYEWHSEITSCIDTLMDRWRRLKDGAATHRTLLHDAIEAQQYYSDANEVESWIKEMMPLVCSNDYGKDEASAQALLMRQNHLDKDIRAFDIEIKRLEELAILMTKSAGEHNISPEKFSLVKNGDTENGDKSTSEVDVSDEIEVEKLIEKEILQDVVETRRIPQVKAMYVYKGQGMKIDKGEILILLQKTNSDWWQIRKSDATEGFVPANYIKEVDPKIVQKVIKRPIRVPETVKVNERLIQKEPLRENGKQPGLHRAPSVRSKANLHYDKENVEIRQSGLSADYRKLCQLSQVRLTCLVEAIKLFHFYRECDEFSCWMQEKEISLSCKESMANDIKAVRKRFEKLLTNMAANKGRLDNINTLATQIIKGGSSQKVKVQRRQLEINQRWEYLSNLKLKKEKSLEGASSIELFKSVCDELQDWIHEKNAKLATDDVDNDLTATHALRRKHAQLERELVPMEEKIMRMDFLADSVRSSYPDEIQYVDGRQMQLHELWTALRQKVDNRQIYLESACDIQQFRNEAMELLLWSNNTKALLENADLPHDIKSGEKMQKELDDIFDDINVYNCRLANATVLGNRILTNDPRASNVGDKLKKLIEEELAVDESCKKRQKQLQDAYNLQVFNRDADNLLSMTNGIDAFLDFKETEETVGDVEVLLRRHEDLDNRLQAQDDRMDSLNELAELLIADCHPDSTFINKRKVEVMDMRKVVKEKAVRRHKFLATLLEFLKFKRDSDELADWMEEKHQKAADESYRDLSNILAKLQKHQAFEAELKSNNDRLNNMNQTANNLIKKQHPNSSEVCQIMPNLKKQWTDLNSVAEDKGKKLREASAQQMLNRTLDGIQAKLDEIEKSVANPNLGSDMRGTKKLLKDHLNLETDMNNLTYTIQFVVEQGKEMADAGHFDSAGILFAVDNFKKCFDKLMPAVSERREKLHNSLLWHKFVFDANNELQLISFYLPAASSANYGRNLFDAQTLHKKQQDLIREILSHQPIVDRVLTTGEQLIDEGHFKSKAIKDKSQELHVSWDDLLKRSKNRKKNIDISLHTQKYLSEVTEVEAWINDKMVMVTSDEYGKDEDASDRLLAKNKVLQTDIQTYQGITNSLAKESSHLQKLAYSDSQMLKKAQDDLQDSLNKLKRLAEERSHRLDRTKWLHAFLRECDDFEEWISEQMYDACSEEYGQDYEHIQILRCKFDEFKRNVDAGTRRFDSCKCMVTYLLDMKGDDIFHIQERQEHVREVWNLLLEQIENRHQKLLAAEEIHRFNRDVEDVLTRIQEKLSSIPDDLGRDFNSCTSFLKRHEAFENELAALEGQVQVLKDDGDRLQKVYPGENSDQIAHLQKAVLEDWAALLDKSEARKLDLLDAADYHHFTADARDLLCWAKEVETEMVVDKCVRDVVGVDLLCVRHDEVRAEIEARQDTFVDVLDTGKVLLSNKHYASDDIAGKVSEVEMMQEQLQSIWLERRQHYDRLQGQKIFFRDADQINAISSSQEVILNSAEYGDTVDQVEIFIRRHNAFEKLLDVQEDKVAALTEISKQFVDDGNLESENIKQTLAKVHKRRVNVRALSNHRKLKLENSLLFVQFMRDIAEMNLWIDEKLKIAYEDDFKSVGDLIDKMKKLQRHQAFESEIYANEDRVKNVKEMGGFLIKNEHLAKKDIQENVASLVARWSELLQASSNRGKGLGEARDILQFKEQVEKVERWMREKELLVGQNDLGRDYEHCLLLQKKADNQESSGITVNRKKVHSINALAEKLISQGRTDVKQVEEERSRMNARWKKLHGNLAVYKTELSAALEVHAFNRDIDDVNERISEKEKLLSVDDLGMDLAGIQTLQRKQETVERDLSALQNHLEKLESTATVLGRKYQDHAKEIERKMREAEDSWERLEERVDVRKAKLADSYQVLKFLSDGRELVKWSTDMICQMNAGDIAKDLAEAENHLQIHHERKAEIDGRKVHFAGIRECGVQLAEKIQYCQDEAKRLIMHLDMMKLTLIGAWDKRNKLLTMCHDLQMFKETAEQGEDWLATKEAFLSNEDLGNSLFSVESRMKNLAEFEKIVRAQECRLDEMKQFASDLIRQKHYATGEIESRCQLVLDRRDRMWKASVKRQGMLQDSRDYQLFLKNLYEVHGWMNEKLQVALDESYKDPINLQAKMQKHQAFEAELASNRNRVDAVVEEGDGLLREMHYANKDIHDKLGDLEMTWQALIAASSNKKARLQDAHNALVFNRLSDDLNSWMEEVESILMSEDHGEDLTSVNSLLKKQEHLEHDIAGHRDKVNDILSAARVFKEEQHFLNKELQTCAKDVSERYNSLAEPCQIRQGNLREAQCMYQFFHDVEDELSWIQDRTVMAISKDVGSSLSSVQALLKKHQALESEIVSHEPLIEMATLSAQQMIQSKHFAADDIQKKMDHLTFQLGELKCCMVMQRQILQAALEAEKYYNEVNEIELWMNEKIIFLSNMDCGKDEESVLSLMKKLDALERDIDNFSVNIKELASSCDGLVDRNNNDSANIQHTQAGVEVLYRRLKGGTIDHRKKLSDTHKFFLFYLEADETANWISDCTPVAASEDYGTDLEHVEILQQKFEEFMNEIKFNEHRVVHLTDIAELLLNEGHFESGKIRRKLSEIDQLWLELNEMMKARHEALAGAREVHLYSRDADDTLEWIVEKDVNISCDDYGHDLESTQTLVSRHDGLERDLAAVSEQVETTTKEAERLIALFPDAVEHIEAKHKEMIQAWNRLVEKASSRKEKLRQAEQLQLYFNECHELMAWISGMQATVMADELAHDLPGAEGMIIRYKEHYAEVNSRQEACEKFRQSGQLFIANGHFLSKDIDEKIKQLDEALCRLRGNLDHRFKLHQQNLKSQKLLHEIEQVEAWMSIREPLLREKNYGDSISNVEELLRRHADFEKTVSAHEERIDGLRRIDKMKKPFLELTLKEEEDVKKVARRDRLDELRKKEQDRIMEERRREEEQHKASSMMPCHLPDEDINGKLEDKLDQSTVKNLIDRSQSIKLANAKNEVERNVRRTVSLRQQVDDSLLADSVQKVADFGETVSGEVVLPTGIDSGKFIHVSEEPCGALSEGNVESDETEPSTPSLPHSPPPVLIEKCFEDVSTPSSSLMYSKKEGLSPPLSPLQTCTNQVSPDKDGGSKKSSKRTSSFNIRRRTRSFKDKYKLPEMLPPPDLKAFVERKQELQGGGKKAAIRSWKSFYAVLFGQILAFFKDDEAYTDGRTSVPPLNIYQCQAIVATDYTKKQHVLRLRLNDGAEYLLEFHSIDEMAAWREAMQHFAEEPQMFTSFDFEAFSVVGGQEDLDLMEEKSDVLDDSHLPQTATAIVSPSTNQMAPVAEVTKCIELRAKDDWEDFTSPLFAGQSTPAALSGSHGKTSSLPSNVLDNADDNDSQEYSSFDDSMTSTTGPIDDQSDSLQPEVRRHSSWASSRIRPLSDTNADERYQRKRGHSVFGFLKKKKDHHKDSKKEKDRATHI